MTRIHLALIYATLAAFAIAGAYILLFILPRTSRAQELIGGFLMAIAVIFYTFAMNFAF